MKAVRNPVLFVVLYVLVICCVASGKVILIGNNVTLSFDDVEANFAPLIQSSGIHGVLYVAEPLNACTNLTNTFNQHSDSSSEFVLIRRGGCSFDVKVKNAQEAGFKAAVIYDNDDNGALVAMAGSSTGIKIQAVFVSKASGEILKTYAGSTEMEVWLMPTFINSAWSIMAISFISLLAMSAVLATCFFVRKHRVRRNNRQASHVREFHGMSRRLVRAIPSLVFSSILDDRGTSETCSICLDDYTLGEKLRTLPCRHNFHARCIDSWLTTWQAFCPVCKRDVRTATGIPPASERTPLFSSTPSSVSSSVLSSYTSSIRNSSSAIQIAPRSSPSPSIPFSSAQSTTSHIHHSFRSSYRHSPSIRHHGSSQRSYTSQLGYPSLSSVDTRFMSSYRPSPNNASTGLVCSSSHRFHPLRCSDSAGTFSPFASNHSLPEC